ncbi:MAG: hypothetical protein U1E05_10170, partial [Patescibacteria group bacterium]|nr:hypothetical protein [Patescibacteria group bacterium]
EVREEATVDQIVEHLTVVRRRAQTDVDRRALDLLELIIERRAGELLNQPGPHGEKALAAMRRAMSTDWTPGEPRLAANLLASLGCIAYQPLANEQVQVLEALHGEAERGTDDRLQIAWCLGRTYWGYQRHDDAIACLESALAEFDEANKGILPASANNALGTLVDYLESRRHFARGEKLLLAQLKHPATTQQQYWLAERLYRLYEAAICNDGTVSLGAGQVLYAAVERRIRDALSTGDANHRHRLIERLCSIYREAKRKNLDGVGNDLQTFAFKQLSKVLIGQTHQYQSIVSQVGETLREVVNFRVALALLIERIEREPAWFRLNNQDGWSQFGHSLAHWRTQVTELGELEPRLLRIVLAELRRDLETQQSRNRGMYHRHHGYFWADKAGDFAATAEAVLTRRANSGVTIAYAAHYLYHGLDRRDRAIEVLLAAYGRNVLDESGKAALVDYLQQQNRHAESIPLLLPLVQTRPDNVNYRVQLMRAYFHAEQSTKLHATLQAAHEHFHAEGRWIENAMALLAYGCLETRLYQQAVDYYREVIAHHQRTRPNRGIGEDALPQYYQWLSQAFTGVDRIGRGELGPAARVPGASDHESPARTGRRARCRCIRQGSRPAGRRNGAGEPDRPQGDWTGVPGEGGVRQGDCPA